jgi:hypothetical protein
VSLTLAFAAACAALGAGDVEMTEKQLVEEDDYELRLSLPTEEDRALWRQGGLRVQLGYAYGRVYGLEAAPSFGGHTVFLRPQMRLDEHWSLGLSFNYVVATGSVGGLTFAALVEPIFHPVSGLSLALGLGYAGIVVSKPYYTEIHDPASASTTLPQSARLNACQGTGFAAGARLEYLFVAGPLFASGPFVAGTLQTTKCAESLGDSDGETGETIELHQWWRHRGFNVGWALAWR